MSGPLSRLSNLAAHLQPSSQQPQRPVNFHTLSPTYFLPRAAAIEPDAEAIYHRTPTGLTIRRTYRDFAARAAGVAHFLRSHGLRRVGILCPNTPAFLESLFGIAGAGAISVGVNYRLKPDDLAYIFEHAEVDCIIADAEFVGLLDPFRATRPDVRVIVDTDAGDGSGDYEACVREGIAHDAANGGKGWTDLEAQAAHEDDLIALAYTSGTTARPKGVEYTHRGCYLAALANVVESGLNYHQGRCRYLWTLPLFHATGWTFPWAITAVRGTHYCLRKVDYPLIWALLKEEGITHFNAAPTVNTLLCASPAAEKLPQEVRVTVAASPPSAHLFRTMSALNLHPVHVYGLTETYGPITKGYHMPMWDRMEEAERFQRMARQGHGFVASAPVRVVRTAEDGGQATGTPVDVRRDGKEIGEIVFTGNICARGYYKDAEATRKLFEGGVLHSGDLAVWHEDGSIQILDRAKDIIISGGENISSVAVEAMLVTHPDILEAGVAAVPDPQWGERPKAFVTIRETRRGDITGPEIVRWAKEQSNISRFMVPAEVAIVAELPKTETGKVRKNVLREWARSGTGWVEG